ncbi:MAG: hypothetical protein ACC635_04180 [Acidiferrobacterales bacterium]
MSNWHTGYLLQGILIGLVLLSAQAWAGEKVTRGSGWVITGKIEVPPRKAEIYYQDGKPVAVISGNQYTPWCRLSFNTKDKQRRIFDKGSFNITKVGYDDEAINDATTSYKITMALKSTDVADVNQIVCGSWGGNSDNYLTVEQIRQVMAGVLKLNLKTGK